MKVMTVNDLICTLQKWTDSAGKCGECEVRITRDMGPIGTSSTHRIVSVSGVAGARIDGADGVVMIFYHPSE